MSEVNDTITTDEYASKKRAVELHVYQEKKYASYLDILKYFTIYCVILLILAILRKRFILSYGFTNILTMILVVVAGIHLFLKISDINTRNNMNFDEYDWSFNQENQSDPNQLDTQLHETTTRAGATCVEADCCDTDYTKWCSTKGLCILKDEECDEEEATNSGNTDYTGNSFWANTPGSCTFPSKTKCKDPKYPYYCPGDNTCYASFNGSNCPSDNKSCGVNEMWCAAEGKCKLFACKSSPCDPETQDEQTKCGAGQVVCGAGPDVNKCVNSYSECGVDEQIPYDCANTVGDAHESCLSGNDHHPLPHVTAETESFISGITNKFRRFKESFAGNVKKNTINTNVKPYNKYDDTTSPV